MEQYGELAEAIIPYERLGTEDASGRLLRRRGSAIELLDTNTSLRCVLIELAHKADRLLVDVQRALVRGLSLQDRTPRAAYLVSITAFVFVKSA